MRRRTSALLVLLALPLSAGCIAALADSPVPVVSQPYHWRNVNIGGGGGFITGIVFSPTTPDVAYVRTDIGGAYRWNVKTKRWVAMTDWVGQADGNLRGAESIAIDPTNPQRVYLAGGTYSRNTPTAILRSTDQGRTWKEAIVPVGMGANENGRNIGERLAVDPNDPSVIYFGSRHDGLWRSTDYAATWSKVTSFPDVPDVTPPPFRFGGGGGAAFRNFVGSAGIGIVVFDPRSKAAGKATQTIYVFADSPKASAAVFRSTDAGATWDAVPGQPTGFLPEHAALADGTLYVTYGNNVGPNGITDGSVWKLDTASGAWTDITPLKPGADSPGGYSGVAIDPLHPGTVMVSTLDFWKPGDDLFRSLDGGAHWKSVRATTVREAHTAPWLDLLQLTPIPMTPRPAPHFGWWTSALAIDPFHPSRVYYGTGATIWGTQEIENVDKGQPTHWTSSADGIEETAVTCLISPTAGVHLLSGVGDIGGFRHESLDVSPPEGLASNPIFTTTSSIDFAQNAPMDVVRAGSGSHGTTQYGAYSKDNGVTWSAFATQPENARGSGSIVITADGKTIVWICGGAAGAYTRDWGATWTTCAGLPAPPAGGGPRSYFGFARLSLVSDRVDPMSVYAIDGQNSAIYRSRDGGATFAKLTTTLPGSAGSLFSAPSKAGDLWVTLGTHGLYHSTDGGDSFQLVLSAPQADTLGFGKAAPGAGYPAIYLVGSVSGVHGVFRSDDEGASWVRINDDQHQYGWIGQHPISGDPRIYGRVYLATDGRGIQYADPADR